MPARSLTQRLIKGACTDWTSYAENNRPNCLIIKALTLNIGPSRFGPVIFGKQEVGRFGQVDCTSDNEMWIDARSNGVSLYSDPQATCGIACERARNSVAFM